MILQVMSCLCVILLYRWDDCQWLMLSAGACCIKGRVCSLGSMVVLRTDVCMTMYMNEMYETPVVQRNKRGIY